jgi:hypothetical protein
MAGTGPATTIERFAREEAAGRIDRGGETKPAVDSLAAPLIRR